MKDANNILLVVDDPSLGSSGLAPATALAQRNGATLTLLHAFEGYAQGMSSSLSEAAASEMEQLEYEAGMGALERMAAGARASGLEVRTCVRIGNPFIEVTREVLRCGHDLVLKETQPARIAGSRLFTSQELHLMRKCPSPLCLMKPTREPGYAAIMAAIDPAPSDEERQELNRRILEVAVEVAQDAGAVLHVAHAWRLRSDSSLRLMRRTLSEPQVEGMMEEERLRRSALVAELVQPYRDGTVRLSVELVMGDPGRMLPTLARRLRVDLLVMGTVARSGVSGLIIGTTAENLLDGISCSVLGLKPRGFVTPVHLPDDEMRGSVATPLRPRLSTGVISLLY